MTFDEWWAKEGIPITDDEYFSRGDMRWIAEQAWNNAMAEAIRVLKQSPQQIVQADACTCAEPDKQFMPSPKAYCGKCGKIIRTA